MESFNPELMYLEAAADVVTEEAEAEPAETETVAQEAAGTPAEVVPPYRS